MTSPSSLTQHIIEHEILGVTSGSGGDSLFQENSDVVTFVDPLDILQIPVLQIGTDDVFITDSTGNLVFQDEFVGPVTLTELKSMRNIWIESLAQPSGSLTLSDATNWNSRYSFISSINVKTTSVRWDLWIHEDNTFSLTSIRSRRIAKSVNGDALLAVNLEVNSSTTSLYLSFLPVLPASAISVYITGEARRH